MPHQATSESGLRRSFLLLAVALLVSAATGQARWRQVMLHSPFWTSSAFDPLNDEVVAYTDKGTWIYRDGEFHGVPTQFTPQGDQGVAMAFDWNRLRVVAFGGGIYPHRGSPPLDSDQTWEWDGQEWHRIVTTRSPPPRVGAGMGFDRNSGKMMLFGGFSSSLFGYYGDTWEFDGTNWTQLSPASSPSARREASLVHDSLTGEFVLVGGAVPGGEALVNDQYVWNGREWIARYVSGAVGTRAVSDPLGRGLLTYDSWRIGVMSGHSGRQLFSLPGLSSPDVNFAIFDPSRAVLMLGASDSWMDREYRYDATSNQVTVVQTEPNWIGGDGWQILSFDPQTRTLWQGCQYRDRFGKGAARITDEGYERIAFTNLVPETGGGALVPMVYHQALDRHIMLDPTALQRRTMWFSDGQSWTSQTFQNGPGNPHMGHFQGLFDDPAANQIVYWSGAYIWTWSQSGGWVLRYTPPTSNTGAYPWGCDVAFDSQRRVLVFVGGEPTTQPHLFQWEFDLATDTMRQIPSQSTSPPAGYVASGDLVYAPAFGGTVFVGSRHTLGTDVRVWDGTVWRPLQTRGNPNPNLASTQGGTLQSAAYDPARRRIVCMPFWSVGDHIWELSLDEFEASPSAVRVGGSLRFDVNLPDRAGELWVLGMSSSAKDGLPIRPSAFLGDEVFPLDPDPLLLASISSWMGGRLDAQGRGSFTLNIPPLFGLHGFRFLSSALTIDSQLRISRATNVEEVRISR